MGDKQALTFITVGTPAEPGLLSPNQGGYLSEIDFESTLVDVDPYGGMSPPPPCCPSPAGRNHGRDVVGLGLTPAIYSIYPTQMKKPILAPVPSGSQPSKFLRTVT